MRGLRRRKVIPLAMVILAALLIYAGLVEPNWVQVNTVEVPIRGLPEQFEGFRIVQLSDLHLAGPRQGLPRLYVRVDRMVNGLSPDLIAVTGDLVSNAAGGELAEDFLSQLKAREGIYLVWGNWDTHYPSAREAITEGRAGSHLVALQNEAQPVEVDGARIWLMGAMFTRRPAGYTSAAFRDAVAKGYQGGVLVLLSHSAVVWKEAEEAGVSLLLCGHTHGGQVWLPLVTRLLWTLPPNSPIYRGFANLGGMWININRGIGTSMAPLRFLSRPEITVITLRRAA